MQQLMRPVARRPAAGLALKPLNPIAAAAKGTVPIPNRACYGLRPLLLPRTSHSSPLLVPAPCSVRGTGRRPCPAPRAKQAGDEAEREPHAPAPAPAPAKQGEEEEAAPERKPGERSMAYQIFAGLYSCAYVFCWRTGELIFLNAQDALDRLRRHVRDNLFNQKR